MLLPLEIKYMLNYNFLIFFISILSCIAIQMLYYIQMQNNQYIQPQKHLELTWGKKLVFSHLLLQSYIQRPSQLQSLTLQQYLTHYNQKIIQPSNFISKLQEQLLVAQYLYLRNTLQAQIQQNIITIQQKEHEVGPTYDQIKNLMGRRQLTCIKTLSSQLQDQKPDTQQELVRVRKIIANGAWGCLDKLQQRISKLRELQNESQ